MRIVFLFLLLISAPAYADTYNARPEYFAKVGLPASSSAVEACQLYVDDQDIVGSSHETHDYAYHSATESRCYYELVSKSTGSVSGPFSTAITIIYRCDYGGTKSGSLCIDAPACPAGQTRDETTGECLVPPVVQDCQQGYYKDQTTNQCVTITTDCNADLASGGGFFDVESGTCKTILPPHVCITGDLNGVGGDHSKYCPPINDCISTGTICANNPANVQAASDKRAAEIAAIQERVAIAKGTLDYWYQQTAAAAAAKKSTATQAQSDAEIAAAAAATASAGAGAGTENAITLQQAAANAAARAANSSIESANTDAQKAIVDAQHESGVHATGTFNSGIDDGMGTNFLDDAAKQVEENASRSATAGSGALAGSAPAGTLGAGSGNSSSPAYGLGYTVGTPVPASVPSEGFYTTKYPDGLTGVWTSHKDSLSNVAFISSLNGLVDGAPASGTCPAWVIDLSGMHLGSFNVDFDCAILGYVKIFILLTAAFTCRSIIFGG